jgi:hypothetical protein
VNLEQRDARLTWHTRENYSGEQDTAHPVARSDWAFANCESTPWPGTPDPARICLKDGFRAGRLYELVYTAKDPLVLGVGLAATRDIVSFFRHAETDAAGTPNPIAGAIDHAVSVGDSQSGNFIRTFIHLGFNRDRQNRMVWDGAFPRIAARQTPMNLRFALPGGAAGVYEPGSEGVVWWTRYEDKRRKLPPAGLLDRCTATSTCPKIFEAFGSSEFWGLRMSPDLLGTDATHDLPLPANVRRYYYPGTTHGGGRGGFRIDTVPNAACVLPANPNPEADQTRALTRALIEWVTKGTPPPDSRYPRLASGELVAATRAAIGFPDVPGLPFGDRVLNPVVRYDFGPAFKAVDLSGRMSIVPPRVLGVVPTYVPRVNEDGNETAGVPSVLMQAPLGTYLGWNVYRSGFFAGQGCGFQGGWIPFARTKAERLANHDPRPSLEERYGTIENYVAIVKRAADQAVRDRFLLPDDAERIVHEAETSGILPHAAGAAIGPPSSSCEPLASTALSNAVVTAARRYPAGDFTSGRTFAVPAFCRVMVTAKPASDSDIKIEVWLPEAWNGKLLGTDNGGFSGAINYAALAAAIAKGYAAVSTDTGHSGDQMDFGIGHPEKIVDWAYRAVHEMTTIARTVVERAKGRGPERSYFSGCSTGGQQALSEAQRYPADYDGVVAGDPGNNRVNLIYGFLWSWLATHDPDGSPILASAKLPALANAAIAACDAADGLADRLIADPRACRFDPAVLECQGQETDACLTPRQIVAVKKVYAGARTKSGEQLYPGWAAGSEAGWGTYITNPKEPVRIGLFRGWVFQDPAWDPRAFDWDKDVAAVHAKYSFLNAVDTDYREFRSRGGKIVMYTGLADPVVSPLDTIAYYESVAKAMGGIDATRSFFRFFPAPGMAHCGGGAGPNTFDALAALERWVEQGTAPDSIAASHATNGRIDRTRPLCAYPAVARYDGVGRIDDAASFSCVR